MIFNPPSHHKSESLDTKISIQSVKSIQRSRITAKMSDDLVCNVCGKQFKSQKKLSDHSWATHSDENLPCSSCDKTFRTKKHLANHMTDKHTEKEPVQCDFKTNDMACTYYSTSKSNLKAHKKRVHKKVTVLDPHKFACSSCDDGTFEQCFELKSSIIIVLLCIFLMCAIQQLQIN